MNIKHILLPLALVLILPFGATGQSDDTPVAPGAFVVSPETPHGVIFILSETWADIREVTGELTKYCVQEGNPLKVNRYSMPYLSNIPVLYVEGFPDKKTVMKFYARLKEENPDFMQMNMITAVWPISQENFYQVVYQESLEGYAAFFEAHY